MSNVDDEIDKIRENFENGLVSCGLDATNVDYDELAEIRTEYKQAITTLLEHTERGARKAGIGSAIGTLAFEDMPLNDKQFASLKNLQEQLSCQSEALEGDK